MAAEKFILIFLSDARLLAFCQRCLSWMTECAKAEARFASLGVDTFGSRETDFRLRRCFAQGLGIAPVGVVGNSGLAVKSDIMDQLASLT